MVSNLKHRIDAAAGRTPADLKLAGGRVVSSLTGNIIRTDVAIADGVIVGFGDYRARRTIDLAGGYLSAGLIDAHLHIESTMLAPAEFARAVLPHGTTAVVADPHEIANVMGERGIRWMLDASEGLPLDFYFGLPSCVPATSLEDAGARLDARDLGAFVDHPRVVAIGEVMNYPAVIAGARDMLEKIRLSRDLRVDGHAPGLTGKELYAYIAAGIHSDHESIAADEAREKLMAGMHLMIREGTTEKNLRALAGVVTAMNSHRCMFCSDDLSPRDIVENGHMDRILRKAVRAGVSPALALQMATVNAPAYFRLKRRVGAVAVGYRADMVVFEDLKSFRARMVFKDGRLVARDGRLTVACQTRSAPRAANTVHIGELRAGDLRVAAGGERMRVIEIVPRQIVTTQRIMKVRVENGNAVADVTRDILKLVVVERHHASGRVGIGFVRGFGLTRGALASSVAHDSHNIIAVGVTDEAIVRAIREIEKRRGGLVAADDRRVLAGLALPIAGLMSEKPATRVARDYDNVQRAARELGATPADPYLQLSFLALPVIPALKLTDRGLVDTVNFAMTELFIEPGS